MQKAFGFELAELGLTGTAVKCEQCGSEARLANGICVRCLLEDVSRSGEEMTEEELARELAEADVPDEDWRLGNYLVLGEIGRGGMGIIYRAQQRHSGRIVALKRVLVARADDRDWLERFRREVRAAASLDHPNVLPIYEIDQDSHGIPYFSMKLASGGSLRRAAGSFADRPREAVGLVMKVARAVQHAHERGVLHRDLQPGNILLDEKGEPLVCDFGLARLLNESSDLTLTRTTFGTPGYIAPEQAEGISSKLTAAADVYSLGAILFYLLARRPPFVGENALSVVKQAASSDAPKLRSIVPALDRALETIVARCLEREPQARYQSAAELADDLERWLDSRRIKARPVSVPARLRRWSSRNPALAASAVICVLLAGGLIWSIGKWNPASTPVAAVEQSIAVLPFQNFTPDGNNRFLDNVVEEDLVTALGKVASLKVISRGSVRDYKPDKPRNLPEIAKALGVRHLLEGSVRRDGDTIRVSARLTDAQTGTQIWADEYERALTQLSAIDGQIARAVGNQLRFSAAQKAAIGKEPTKDFAAYDLYLEATELTYSSMASPDPAATLKKAALLLEEATRRDPDFVRAYCELARANENLYWNDLDRTPERLAMAKAALDQAVQRGPNFGETHMALARYDYTVLRDYDKATRELEIAHRLLPNDSGVLVWQGLVDRRLDHWPEALRTGQRAHELNPRDGETIRSLSDTLIEMRLYDEAERLLKGAIATIPQHAPVFIAKLCDCYLGRGEPEKIVAMYKTIPAHPGTGGFEAYYRFTVAMFLRDFEAAKKTITGTALIPDHVRGPFCTPAWFEGLLARAEGQDEGARAAFTAARDWARVAWGEEPSDPIRLSLLARIEAGLGEKEAAIRHARAAVAMRPLERDSLDGPTIATALALVYAWTGERDLALEQLAVVAARPAGPTYGNLQLHPQWDPLRGDPRFESIVAALQPKK